MLISITAWFDFAATASTNGHTQAEAVAWAKSMADNHTYCGQCVALIQKYYAYLGVSVPNTNANTYANADHIPPGWYVDNTPSLGAVYVESNYSPGHVSIVVGVDSAGTLTTVDSNVENSSVGQYNAQYFPWTTGRKKSDYSGVAGKSFVHPDFGSSQTITGSEMTSGYDRAIPDGQYLIANAGTTDKTSFYYLDIDGTAQPATNGTNVILTGPLTKDPPSYEIWDIKYSNGFYTIKQTGTETSLDVWAKSNVNGANIGVSSYNGGSNQKWAISKNGRNGYRIQSKNTGFSVDVKDGGTNTGTNIQQCVNNSSDAQSWLFIPYKPSQTLAEGRYILISALSDSLELDIPGDTGNVEENINVQVWSDKAQSKYNAFDVKKLSNGYYKLIHVTSGKSLDVSNAISTYDSNIALHTSNDSVAQQWAITKDGYNGGYIIRTKCSGLVADVAGEKTSNGTNVMQHPFNGGKNQTWKFVKAEYSVKYNANGGTGIPATQIKYYKDDLHLSNNIPLRTNYDFIGWNTKIDGSGTSYGSGSVYKADKDITLYAQWEKTECNHISYNGIVARKATLTTTGIKVYKCTVCGQTIKTETIAKNEFSVKAKKPTVKYKKLKKKNQTIALKNAMTVSKAQGSVIYTKSSGNKKITINKKTGKITVKKGLKKGTYKVKIKVKAAGNASYKAATKTVTVPIKVK